MVGNQSLKSENDHQTSLCFVFQKIQLFKKVEICRKVRTKDSCLISGLRTSILETNIARQSNLTTKKYYIFLHEVVILTFKNQARAKTSFPEIKRKKKSRRRSGEEATMVKFHFHFHFPVVFGKSLDAYSSNLMEQTDLKRNKL